MPRPGRELHDNEYTMIEYNFSPYFGLGVSMQGGRPRVTDDGVARDIFLEIPAVGRRGGVLPNGFLQ